MSTTFAHTFALNPEGEGLLLWRQPHDETWHTWVRAFSLQGGWGEPMELGNLLPHIVIDAEGNAVATWLERDAVWARRFRVGTGWEDIVRVDADGLGRPIMQEVVMTANGSPVVTWVAYDTMNRPSLYVSSWQP
jgi:hypothetical protein